MTQLVAVIFAFSLIPILTKKKFKLSYTLLILAGVLGIISGIGPENVGRAILNVFTETSSRTSILTVFMIGILGGLMKHYNILDEIVDTLLLLIRDKRKILMIIPATIGLLLVPGGALLSAPFIKNIGEDMGLSPARSVAINLVFRHIAMFIMPYSTSLLIVSAVFPEMNIFKLILLNLIFVCGLVFFGYVYFIRDMECELSPTRENLGQNILKLVIYTLPITSAVLLNIITGLPFYITLIGSIFIVYLLGDKKDFLKVTLKSISWDTVLTIIAILILKEIILNMEGLLGIFNAMFSEDNGMFSIMFIMLIASFFFGYITGSHSASLAITLPMVSQLNVVGNMFYIYVYFAYGAGFLGYYFSPIHLCQAFTCEHMGVTTEKLYKEYKYYIPSVFLVLIVSTLVLSQL